MTILRKRTILETCSILLWENQLNLIKYLMSEDV